MDGTVRIEGYLLVILICEGRDIAAGGSVPFDSDGLVSGVSGICVSGVSIGGKGEGEGFTWFLGVVSCYDVMV